MLLMLTFLACVGSGPQAPCQTIEIAWDGPSASCPFMGQLEAARWLGEHPGYRLRGGYRCLPGRAI